MRTTTICLVLLTAVITPCIAPGLLAQDDGSFSPFARRVMQALAKQPQPASGQKHPDQEVLNNINVSARQRARSGATHPVPAAIPPAPHSAFAVTASGSISGTVYMSDGVTPVSSYVPVTAYSKFGLYCGSGYALTGNPVYQIQNLPTGDYYVQLENFDGQYIAEYYNGVISWYDATLVHVVDGQATTGIDFVLRQYRGAIAGTVRDANGIPVAQGAVEVYDLYQNLISYGFTDSTGKYTVGGLPTGNFKVEDSPHANYVTQWFDRASTFEAGTLVNVVEPETTKGKDFILEPGGVISGEVLLQAGDMLLTNACSITAENADGSYAGYSQNDSAGRFSITGLGSGSYWLSYQYYGPGNYPNGWYNGAANQTHATPVQVTAA